MPLRIVSMLSSATEIVYALGLQDHLVAISHECDFPPEALSLPRASRSRFNPVGMTSGEIDAAVRRSMEEHGSVYEVDAEQLHELRPDVILTQAVCEVCAVPTGSVRDAVVSLGHQPEVVSLDAHTVDGILHSMLQVAEAVGRPERGAEIVGRLRQRIADVEERVSGRVRPEVLLLEWLDPPFAPGHWVPEMVERAGGINLLGRAGHRSEQIQWDDLTDMDPSFLLVEPCGYDLRDARVDADRHRERLMSIAGGAIRTGGAWLLHSSYFSRSGPRIIDGIEVLARVLHPDRFSRTSLEGRAERWQ